MLYLDSAATTLQKPLSVKRAVQEALERMASPGRGGHSPAMLAGETAFGCRQCAAELFHLDAPEQVIFTFNATHALNLAIKSLVHRGDEVVISGYEHNAVTRPLTALGCRIKVARAPLFQPQALLSAFEELISRDTSCVICTHVSNVFGCVLPVYELAELCHKRSVPFIVDAAQSAGCLPVHMDALDCAFAAMPGHKGLYGPQGTGLLLCGRGQKGQPLLEGGTGSVSKRQTMPDFLPDRLEAGTHNVPGIAGLWAGLRYVNARSEQGIFSYEAGLIDTLSHQLKKLPGVAVFSTPESGLQGGVLSFYADGWDCESLGEALGEREVAVRAGLHCAPTAHETVGTLERGTIRVSVSDFNTEEDIWSFVRILQELLK